MRQALDAIASLLTDGRCDARTLDWAALRYRHTAAVRSVLMERYSPKTANNMLTALRRVLKEALRLELMDASDYARAVDIKGIKSVRGLRGRALASDEIAALMNVCLSDPTPQGARDAALIAILRGTGLRRAEVVKLDIRDFTTSLGGLEVRGGKGNKDRIVYLPDGLMPVMEDWLLIRGCESGPLLCHVNKAGRVVKRRLTPQAVLFLLQKRAEEAGVSSFSPHDFRRTFISNLLDAGVDMVTVQKLAGHSSPETTALYDRRGEEAKKRAVNLLKF
jgi:site-specific recombinase XerD